VIARGAANPDVNPATNETSSTEDRAVVMTAMDGVMHARILRAEHDSSTKAVPGIERITSRLADVHNLR
jgi:hypothetical protein